MAMLHPWPLAAQEQTTDPIPWSMQPWRDSTNANVMILEDGWDFMYKRRDSSGDPAREPGPINLQRYEVVPTRNAFPTYFGLPFAMTTEDLIAGEVDVAIVGLPSDFNPAEGTGWAANQIRFNRNYDFAEVGHDIFTNLHYFEILNVVDYGNANSHPTLMVHNFANQALVLKEILESGATFMAIGGDHGTQVASVIAVVDHFGPNEIAMVHFDAHPDLSYSGYGVFTHGARARRWAQENGWIRGEDMHTIGIRGPYQDAGIVDYMREVGDRYHFMPEFERDGFEAVWDRIKAELAGKRLYISVDVDVLDPAFAPGVSNPDPGGLTSQQMIKMLRGLAIQNEVVGIDFCEYSPLMDDQHYNTGNMVNRMMRAFLAGKAARKLGITDPDYYAPEAIREAGN